MYVDVYELSNMSTVLSLLMQIDYNFFNNFLTRLLAASLEVLSSDSSLRWPRGVAPYSAILIGPKVNLRF
jgi:hypothetical protein